MTSYEKTIVRCSQVVLTRVTQRALHDTDEGRLSVIILHTMKILLQSHTTRGVMEGYELLLYSYLCIIYICIFGWFGVVIRFLVLDNWGWFVRMTVFAGQVRCHLDISPFSTPTHILPFVPLSSPFRMLVHITSIVCVIFFFCVHRGVDCTRFLLPWM